MMITFTVPGIPVGKGRACAAVRGGHVRMFTPAKTVSYEAQLKHFAQEAMTLAGLKPMAGPLCVVMDAAFPKPVSWSKKKASETVWHTSKPDHDNLMKCLDGLNGVVWGDDAQVAMSHVKKFYTNDGTAYLRVTVSEL